MKGNNQNGYKVLIVAPFWQKPGHVGNFRVERFIRWLKNAGYSVYVLNAGIRNKIKENEWGVEITIKDHLVIISEKIKYLSNKPILKILWYTWISLLLVLSPVDEFFLWAMRVSSRGRLDNYFKDCNLIISTSPQNSSHIAAYKISIKYSIPLITDFRDGWIDEPFEKKINKLKGLNKLEEKWEEKILIYADKIFVTSNNWKNLLIDRIPQLAGKVILLTNAYPQLGSAIPMVYNSNERISVIYTGRIAASDISRDLDTLLEPFFNYLKNYPLPVEIIFISDLRREEQNQIKKWRNRFNKINIKLLHKPQVQRKDLYEEVRKASGLFLLTTKMGTIPLKMFDYIELAKPILAITPKESAVWQMNKLLPQLFLLDYLSEKKDYSVINDFLNACKNGNYEYKIPTEFSEYYLSKVFLKEIESILN